MEPYGVGDVMIVENWDIKLILEQLEVLPLQLQHNPEEPTGNKFLVQKIHH